jgi:hypothetical protein
MVGTLSNVDARPADTTITGVLRDAGGRELARNNAETTVIHKLLPGETTPFVIRFDAVDTVVTERLVASAAVDAKGVVSSRDLTRSLGVWTEPGPRTITSTVVNLGTREATIGHLLLGLYDAQGLAWVNHAFLPRSLAPGDQQRLLLGSNLPAGYRVLMNVKRSVEGLQAQASAAPPTVRSALPGNRQYAVWMHDFKREAE